MRDPARIARIADLLLDIWVMAPDLRLGQIISNAAPLMPNGDRITGHHLFNIEDDEMEQGLREFKELCS